MSETKFHTHTELERTTNSNILKVMSTSVKKKQNKKCASHISVL
jgi:hypothetical protein